MAKDVGDVIGTAIGRMAREAAQSVSTNARKASNGQLSGFKGVAAGAGLAAIAPLAVKGAGKLVRSGLQGGAAPVKKAGAGMKDVVGKTVDQAGDAAGAAKDTGKGLLPGGGRGGRNADGLPGVGKGRRLPVQQAVDVAVPIKTAYNQWTQFEDWPKFMHRLQRVTQEDESHVSFKTKIWGISKEFEAEIVEQRPDERIKWRVSQGVSHTGVVTFHQLSDRLTRIEVNVDVHPDSLLEKAGRGLRHVKRAVRADLARFKAYVEMEEEETGAWRGVIHDGEVKSSRSRSSSSGGRSRSSSKRTKASSSGSRSRSTSSKSGSASSGSRSRSSSGRGKAASAGARGGSSSSRSSSNGSSRSSSAKGRSSANRSRASSNGRSTSGRKKSGSRS